MSPHSSFKIGIYTLLSAMFLAGTTAPATCTPATAAIKENWRLDTKTGMPLYILPDKTGSDLVYLALKEGGLKIVKDLGMQVESLAEVPAKKLGSLAVTAIEQKNNLLYLALGNFFSARGSHAGLAVLDISDPSRPVVKNVWSSNKRVKGANCLTIAGDYLYLGAMNEGVYIFSLEKDPTCPRYMRLFQPDTQFPKKNPGKVNHPNVRDIKVRNEFMYVAYDAGGLRVIDIEDRINPREIARYINPAMSKKQQAYNGIALDYPLAYLTVDYAGLEVVRFEKGPDDNLSVRQIAWWNPWMAGSKGNIWFNSGGHANHVYLDRVKKELFISAGASELIVLDVGNPAKPVPELTLGSRRNKLGAWSLAIYKRKIYLGYIKAFIPFRSKWNGVRSLSFE